MTTGKPRQAPSAEVLLRESEQRYRQLVEHMRSGVVVYAAVDDGADFVIQDFNRAAAEIERVDRADVIGQRITEAFPGVEPFGILDVFRQVWKTGVPMNHPVSFYRDDRISGWRENFVYRLPNGEVVAIYDDVTERLQSEEELRYHADLLDNLSDAVISTDRQHIIRSWNRAAEEIYGYTEAEALGRTTADLLNPEYVSESRDVALRSLLDSGTWVGETAQRAKDGRMLQMATSARVVHSNDGVFLGAVGVHRDIGEQRRLEAKVVRNERLASVGLLAAGVAHEINNPLTYTLFNLEALVEHFLEVAGQVGSDGYRDTEARRGERAAADELLNQALGALDGARRVMNIVKELNTFSRTSDHGFRTCHVHEILDTAIKFADNEIRFRARLHKDYAEVPAVVVNEGRLAQVFLNLIINAAHAIEEGDLENNEIRVRIWLDGGRVAVSFLDTGHGVPPEQLPRIFDPFFTTKTIGQGTGMGLSICNNIVISMGGSIDVESESGQGSEFVVRIPVGDPARSPVEQDLPPRPVPVSAMRVLIVDDEPEVAEVISQLLPTDHDVVIAMSGEEALRILEHDAAFDRIICDLMMPGLTGMDLFSHLEQAHNPLAARMVFVSGGAFTPRAQAFFEQLRNPRLIKPFSRQDLLDALHTVPI